MSVNQCHGITKKGTRCLNKAGENGYCWQHKGQNISSLQPVPNYVPYSPQPVSNYVPYSPQPVSNYVPYSPQPVPNYVPYSPQPVTDYVPYSPQNIKYIKKNYITPFYLSNTIKKIEDNKNEIEDPLILKTIHNISLDIYDLILKYIGWQNYIGLYLL